MVTSSLLRACCGILVAASLGNSCVYGSTYHAESRETVTFLRLEDSAGNSLTQLPEGLAVTHSVSWWAGARNYWNFFEATASYRSEYSSGATPDQGSPVPYSPGESYSEFAELNGHTVGVDSVSVQTAYAIAINPAAADSVQIITISNETATDYRLTLEIWTSFLMTATVGPEGDRTSLQWSVGPLWDYPLHDAYGPSSGEFRDLLQVDVLAGTTAEISIETTLFALQGRLLPEPSTHSLVLFILAALLAASRRRPAKQGSINRSQDASHVDILE